MTRRRRPRTAQERVVGALASVAPGALGGRVRNVGQATPVVRNTGPGVAAGAVGFDADPTIIGPDAAAGSESDPRFGTVIIGREAYADAISSIAIGYNARVDHDATHTSGSAIAIGNHALADGQAGGAVAIGQSAQVSLPNSVAIGNSATSTGQESIAIGIGSQATADDAVAIGAAAAALGGTSVAIGSGSVVDSGATSGVAIGAGAHSRYSNSVALGAAAVTDRSQQLRFSGNCMEVTGASSKYALHSPDNTRWEVSVSNAGALVVTAVA